MNIGQARNGLPTIEVPVVGNSQTKQVHLCDKYGNDKGLSPTFSVNTVVSRLLFGTFEFMGYDLDDFLFETAAEYIAPTLSLPIVIGDLSYLPQDQDYYPVVLRMNYNYYNSGVVGVNEGLLCNLMVDGDKVYFQFPYSGSASAAQLYRWGTDLQYKGLSPISNLDDWADDVGAHVILLITQSGFDDYSGYWVTGSNDPPICVVDFPLSDIFGMQFEGDQSAYSDALSEMQVGDKLALLANGVYIENELVQDGDTPVYRTHVLPCFPKENESALAYSYQDTTVGDSVLCDTNVVEGVLSDYWSRLGLPPLPYPFEEDCLYMKYPILLPQYFIEF